MKQILVIHYAMTVISCNYHTRKRQFLRIILSEYWYIILVIFNANRWKI